MKYRKIKEDDDQKIAEIIRENLQRLHLDIPGTAYFDPELDHLSAYYTMIRPNAFILSHWMKTGK